MPNESRGYDVFVFIKAPTMATSWAASRARREDPADLESLWQHCPRADWLLKTALAAGLEAAVVIDVAKTLLPKNSVERSDEEVLSAVTELVDEHLASNTELQELEEEAAAVAAGGTARAIVSPIGDLGMHGDRVFELQHKVEQLRQKLNAELSDPVRKLIPYKQIHSQLYGGVESSPYR